MYSQYPKEQTERKGALQEDRTKSDWNPLRHHQPWNLTLNIQGLWCTIWAPMDLVSPATQVVPCNANSLVGIHTPSISRILGFLLHSITQWLLRASSWRSHLHPCYMFSDTSDLRKPWYKPPQPRHACSLMLWILPHSSSKPVPKTLKFMVRFTVATTPLYSNNFLNYLLFLLHGENLWWKQLRVRKVSLD